MDGLVERPLSGLAWVGGKNAYAPRGVGRWVLRSIKCTAAISGYKDEWDDLGWERAEKTIKLHSMGASSERTEVLWMNYTPQQGACNFA